MNDFPFCIQSFVLEMWLVLYACAFTWGAIQVQKISTCMFKRWSREKSSLFVHE